MKHLAVTLLLASCAPQAKSPTATDVATTAVILTDDALAIAIAVQPSGFDREPWRARVAALKAVADTVESGGQVCPLMPSLASVATDIGCSKCLVAIVAAKEALKCQ